MRLLLACLLLLTVPAMAENGAVVIAVVTQQRDPVQPVSPLDGEIWDEGVAGARLGIADNATTGRFTGQHFLLVERTIASEGDAADAIRALAAEGIRFVVAVSMPPRLPPPPLPLRSARCWSSTLVLRTMSCAMRSAARACCMSRRAAPCWPMPWRSI